MSLFISSGFILIVTSWIPIISTWIYILKEAIKGNLKEDVFDKTGFLTMLEF